MTRTPSRERLVEQFGEDHVERTEWWADEMDRVGSVQEAVLQSVWDRDDVQVARRGRSVSEDGEHEVTFRLRVAGEPYEASD